MTEDKHDETDRPRAARLTRRAAEDLEEAAEVVGGLGQEKHLSDLAKEAGKTADVLEDQVSTESEGDE